MSVLPPEADLLAQDAPTKLDGAKVRWFCGRIYPWLHRALSTLEGLEEKGLLAQHADAIIPEPTRMALGQVVQHLAHRHAGTAQEAQMQTIQGRWQQLQQQLQQHLLVPPRLVQYHAPPAQAHDVPAHDVPVLWLVPVHNPVPEIRAEDDAEPGEGPPVAPLVDLVAIPPAGAGPPLPVGPGGGPPAGPDAVARVGPWPRPPVAGPAVGNPGPDAGPGLRGGPAFRNPNPIFEHERQPAAFGARLRSLLVSAARFGLSAQQMLDMLDHQEEAGQLIKGLQAAWDEA